MQKMTDLRHKTVMLTLHIEALNNQQTVVMGYLGTIILTSPRPDLERSVAGLLSGMQVLCVDEHPPSARIDGKVWCFVDWLLPKISGLEMCRRLRDSSATAHSHITLVLDEADSEARRRALRAGADDYIEGPLTADLLLARVRHYRAGPNAAALSPRLAHGDLTMNLEAQQVRWHGHVVVLRPNEFRLLAHFMENSDQLYSRTSLISILGKNREEIDERTVDVWVGRLRRALKAHGVPDPMRTVRSMGYVLDSLPE